MALIGKRIVTEEDRARQARKERELRRRQFLKSNIGQKKPKHSIQGISSLIYGIVVLTIIASMLMFSYSNKGSINFLFGVMGLVIMFASYVGLRKGLKGLKEVNKNYITCRWGIGINGTVLGLLIAMFIRGLL
ncbi:MAG: DUF6142 family protein [Dorea sp.]|nr:DUF6142 family protein [Dorea sp.]